MMRVLLLIAIASPAFAQVPRVLLPAIETPSVGDTGDIAKLSQRIVKNGNSVSDELTKARTEPGVLRDQKQVNEDLDELIRLLEPPPPPPQSSGGGGTSNDKKQNDSNNRASNSPPPPVGGQRRGSASPSPKSDAGQPKEAKPQAAGAAPGSPMKPTLPTLPPEESLARDFWGHLPDSQRAQMTQYYREQAMTKYRDLLAEYYKSLAEKEKKGAK